MAGTEPESGQGASEAKLGRRQQGITERRRKLVRAAGELIAEKENGNFSMPELAARAGVSLATPYNLFGSKAAVLVQLFEGQIRSFNRDNSWMNDAAPVERVFGVIDRLVNAYSRQPAFFRNLIKALHALGASEPQHFAYPAAAHLLHPLVQGLAADGHLSPQVPAGVLELTLTRLFDGAFQRWALQDWDTERLRQELRASFALVFYGVLDSGSDGRDQTKLGDVMKAGILAA